MACNAPTPTRASTAAAAFAVVWLLPLGGMAGAAVEISSVEQNLSVDARGRVVDVTPPGAGEPLGSSREGREIVGYRGACPHAHGARPRYPHQADEGMVWNS